MPDGLEYAFVGVGPDGSTGVTSGATPGERNNNIPEFLSLRSGAGGITMFYDPTNGTVSSGDIIYFGPGMGFEPTRMKPWNP